MIWYKAVLLAVLLVALRLFVRRRDWPRHSAGLPVRIASDTCDCHPLNRTVVLRISSRGELSLNYEAVDLGTLAGRLAMIYSTRPAERVLYLLADDDVPFQQVADVIEIVQHTKMQTFRAAPARPQAEGVGAGGNLEIQLRLVTPNAVNAPCGKNCYNWGKQGPPMLPTPRL